MIVVAHTTQTTTEVCLSNKLFHISIDGSCIAPAYNAATSFCRVYISSQIAKAIVEIEARLATC